MKYLLLLAAILLIGSSCEGRTLLVGSDSQIGYKTIEDAVSHASFGDEIVVMNGEYDGATIDRSLTISGLGSVVIKSRKDAPLILMAPNCRLYNVSIQGFEMGPCLVIESSDNILSNCSFNSNRFGLQVKGSNNTIINSQVISSIGIDLIGSKCKIQNDTFKGDYGIKMKDSNENLIQSCKFFTTNGLDIVSSNKNLISDNSLSGSGFGVILTDSAQNRLLRNTILGQYISGFDVVESFSNNISHNYIEG
jgi:parallel beta-helix repeat protein